MSTAESPVGAKKKPVVTFGGYRTGGGSQIEVAVWANEGTGDNAGRVFYGVSFTRSYYDGKDAGGKDRFERTQSLRPQDIPALQYGLQQAFEWILERQILDRQNGQEEEESGGEF